MLFEKMSEVGCQLKTQGARTLTEPWTVVGLARDTQKEKDALHMRVIAVVCVVAVGVTSLVGKICLTFCDFTYNPII